METGVRFHTLRIKCFLITTLLVNSNNICIVLHFLKVSATFGRKHGVANDCETRLTIFLSLGKNKCLMGLISSIACVEE